MDKIVIDGDTYLNDGNLNLAGYDADSKTYTFTNVQADRSIVVTLLRRCGQRRRSRQVRSRAKREIHCHRQSKRR